VFLVINLLSVAWPGIMLLPVLWVVKRRISVNRGLGQAGADTPPMREAVLLHVRTEREIQRARLRFTMCAMRFIEKLPSGELRKTGVTNLEAVGPSQVEPPDD
jgi:hypothetical protein